MAKQTREDAAQQIRTAEQAFNDALGTAKRLKAKSREAKRSLKQAKKVAKKASKASRAARKEAEKARRRYRDALARAAKQRNKAAKEKEAIVTPNKRSARDDSEAEHRTGQRAQRAHRRTWDVSERGEATRSTR